MPARVIAVINQKGGVGKTTTVINLGASIAMLDQRVLLVDLDPQANLTAGLGHRAGSLEDSIHAPLLEGTPINHIITQTRWKNLFLAPSHIDLAGAELQLIPMVAREMKLADALAPIINDYDFIFIDCQPSLSILNVNAMTAAGEILVPMQAQPFALEGIGKLKEMVALVKNALNPELRLSGIVLTMIDIRTKLDQMIIDELTADPELASILMETCVRMNIRIAESQRQGIPIIHYDKNAHGAKAYMNLAYEVLNMGKEENNGEEETEADSEEKTASLDTPVPDTQLEAAAPVEELVPSAQPREESEAVTVENNDMKETETLVEDEENEEKLDPDDREQEVDAGSSAGSEAEPDKPVIRNKFNARLKAIEESLSKIRRLRED